ncbi:MAG: hypothetical protein IJE97_11495, partial [Thermoguttaceae bacterium]|nr:hypothetical protein [Thermoguttaceae bacterium]
RRSLSRRNASALGGSEDGAAALGVATGRVGRRSVSTPGVWEAGLRALRSIGSGTAEASRRAGVLGTPITFEAGRAFAEDGGAEGGAVERRRALAFVFLSSLLGEGADIEKS